MKQSKLFLLAFFISSLSLLSQVNTPIPIAVGPQPTFIDGYFNFTQNDYKLVVATLGIDQNFDGKQDSGDVKPALYQISVEQIMSGNLKGSLLTELEFGSLPFPTRIYLDKIGNFAFVPNKLSIHKILLESGVIITTINPFENTQLPPDSYISSIYYFNGYLFIGVAGLNQNSFYIIKENTLDILFETAVEHNPIQSIVVDNYLFILNEGLFGQNNSKLWIYEIKSFEQWEIVFVKEIEIGDTGNHLAKVGNDKILITMNGSHQVHIFNVQNLEIEKTIQLPTKLYDGPRESRTIQGNIIVTTAYDGNLYSFDFNGNLLGKINVENKLEGLFAYTLPNPNMNFSIVAATSPFLPNYQPNDKVYLFLNFINSVESVNLGPNIFPNPANDFVNFDFSKSYEFPVIIEIIDNLGRKLKEYKFDFLGSKVQLPTGDLPVGSYFARIVASEKSKLVHFVVAR